MHTYKATAFAHPNIAFIKYWGVVDSETNIPANGSISMNLAGLHSQTTVEFNPELPSDNLTLNGKPVYGVGLDRVIKVLDVIRNLAKTQLKAQINSQNNFPTGSGIASSASGFAALAVASSHAAGLQLSEKELSTIARIGSGSACRSIPGGFVEWHAGDNHSSSFAQQIAPLHHWDLADCVVILSKSHKDVGSNAGHLLATSSPYQFTRVADARRRIDLCREAILNKDFEALAFVMELDSNMMHAVMTTSSPPLFYYEPTTLSIIKFVKELRKQGFAAAYTIDAGPNVHVICQQSNLAEIKSKLLSLPGVHDVLSATPGGPAKLLP